MTERRTSRRAKGSGNSWVGVVDIGSNSVRLVVYDGLTRSPAIIFNEKVNCELGRGLNSHDCLHPDKARLALRTLARFGALLDRLPIAKVRVAATSAVRVAQDGPEFVQEAERLLGYPVEVISGDEEARLSAVGVLASFPDANGVVGDLGGGSLELAEVKNGRIGHKVTLRLGHQRLADMAESKSVGMSRIPDIIEEHLAAIPWLKRLRGRTLYAVGGGWRRLAEYHIFQTDYPLEIVDHYTLKTEELAEFLHPKRLSNASEKRHAEVMTLSAMVMEGMLRLAQPAEVVFSGSGLREGILFEMLPKREREREAVLAACESVARHLGCLPSNLAELQNWLLALFEEQSAYYRHLFLPAAVLSDLSLLESRDRKSDNAFHRILNFPMLGLSHAERIFLALAIYARYAGNVRGDAMRKVAKHLAPGDVEMAKDLGMALRLAHALSANRPGLLPHMPLSMRDDRLVLDVPSDLMALAEGESVRKYLLALGNALSLQPVIQEAAATGDQTESVETASTEF